MITSALSMIDHEYCFSIMPTQILGLYTADTALAALFLGIHLLLFCTHSCRSYERRVLSQECPF